MDSLTRHVFGRLENSCVKRCTNREELTFPAFERLFHQGGLPRAIRSDTNEGS
jgi:predicted AAA+ superfamily ATPase